MSERYWFAGRPFLPGACTALLFVETRRDRSLVTTAAQREVNLKSKGSLLVVALLGASLLLSACATVKGLGRDIESVGQAGQDAIN